MRVRAPFLWIAGLVWAAPVALAIAPGIAVAEIKVHCPDGDRYELDIEKVKRQYQPTEWETTLSALSKMTGAVEAEVKTLQVASQATQHWNQFLRVLVAGHNSCLISEAEYNQAFRKIIPGLAGDGKELERLRRESEKGRALDGARLQKALDGYVKKLERLDAINRTSIVQDITREIALAKAEIVEHPEADLESMKREFKQLKQQLTRSPLATPQEVSSEIGELKRSPRGKADDAQTAYERGYKLIEGTQYAEAVTYLERALSILKLPEFCLALGQAYSEIPRPADAERVLREGLELAEREAKERQQGALSNDLGLQLLYKGDLEGAQRYAERALQINEKVYGPQHADVAIAASNLGQILQAKGSLEEARHYAERALQIDEKVYGPDHPQMAIAASNLGAILQAKGDHEGARRYTERALQIQEKVYGPDHPTVAILASNLGAILKDKGDLDGAQRYTEQALRIDEKAYGPDHSRVGIDANDLGQILKAKGDLDGARRYTERALKIFEARLGSKRAYTRATAENLQRIKEDLQKKEAEGR